MSCCSEMRNSFIGKIKSELTIKMNIQIAAD